MEQILSQNEVNALLAAVEGGQIETEAEAVPLEEGVVSLDLTSQDRIIRHRMSTLEIINDRFARQFRMTLTNSLRKITEVVVEATSMMKFSEFLSYLPVPSCVNMIRLNPLKGTCLMSIEVKLLYGLLDLFFGGTSQSIPNARVEGRDFTPIEISLIRKITDVFLHDMQQMWEPIYPISAEYIRTEINPQFVVVVPPSEVVINSSFEIEVDQVQGRLNFVIPYATIEPIKQKLQSGIQGEQEEIDTTWAERFAEQLSKSEVEFAVELGRTNVSVKEMIELQKGDVLTLDSYAQDPVNLVVDNRPKYNGNPVVSKSNLAISILDRVKEESMVASENL